jgi:hypothetical protein
MVMSTATACYCRRCLEEKDMFKDGLNLHIYVKAVLSSHAVKVVDSIILRDSKTKAPMFLIE